MKELDIFIIAWAGIILCISIIGLCNVWCSRRDCRNNSKLVDYIAIDKKNLNNSQNSLDIQGR